MPVRRPADVLVSSPSRPPTIGALLRGHADLLPAIALGGAIGSLARWGLAEALPHSATAFAWSTWLVNVTGAFALGLLMPLVLALGPHRRRLRPFLGAGVLGGFTTFSTWMLDVRTTLDSSALLAVTSLAATLVLGLIATVAGLTAGRTLARSRR